MDRETLITQLLTNSLSDKDKKIVDALLETDVEFAKEVAFQQSLQKVIAKKEYTQDNVPFLHIYAEIDPSFQLSNAVVIDLFSL